MSADPPRFADSANDQPLRAQVVRSPIIRIAYFALAGSVVVTFVGTVLLAQGNTAYESTASSIRHLGLTLMLICCCAVLVGHRMPQLRRFYEIMQNGGNRAQPHPTQESGWRRDTRTGPAAASPHVRRARIKQSQISLGGLFALTTIAAVLFGAVVTTHDLVFVFLAVYGHWTLISMCIVVIVFDRGLPQAFCLAAITPAILSMVAATFFVPWMGSAGEIAIRIAFVVNFVVILLIGLAGVGMRVWLAAVAQPSEFRDAGQQVPQNHARETRRARSPEAD